MLEWLELVPVVCFAFVVITPFVWVASWGFLVEADRRRREIAFDKLLGYDTPREP